MSDGARSLMVRNSKLQLVLATLLFASPSFADEMFVSCDRRGMLEVHNLTNGKHKSWSMRRSLKYGTPMNRCPIYEKNLSQNSAKIEGKNAFYFCDTSLLYRVDLETLNKKYVDSFKVKERLWFPTEKYFWNEYRDCDLAAFRMNSK